MAKKKQTDVEAISQPVAVQETTEAQPELPTETPPAQQAAAGTKAPQQTTEPPARREPCRRWKYPVGKDAMVTVCIWDKPIVMGDRAFRVYTVSLLRSFKGQDGQWYDGGGWKP